MTGKALVCKLGTHQDIEGADKIVQVDMFGETIITQKTNEEGTVGLLFDCETQLSEVYAGSNNMYRHRNLNYDKSITGYMNYNARVKPIKLKGVKCSALFIPLNSLLNLNIKLSNLNIGEEFDTIEGITICKKYVSPETTKAMSNKQGKVKKNLTATFKEHFDTDQWGRNKHKVKSNDLIIITEKLHGTSARCGYLPVTYKLTWWQNFWHGIAALFGYGIFDFKNPDNLTDYKFVVGSRRVVKSIDGNEAENKEHFYNHDLWTEVSKNHFKGKLNKGETIYFEILGYDLEGSPIMGTHSNDKLKNFMNKNEFKKFKDKYGDNTVFHYGCGNKEQAIYVYRISNTNEDGETYDLSWEQLKVRCERLGVKHVPELEVTIVYNYKGVGDSVLDMIGTNYGEDIDKAVIRHSEEDSKEFPGHIREGVCIRIENGTPTPLVLKNKAFIFKALESIIKDKDILNIEESN